MRSSLTLVLLGVAAAAPGCNRSTKLTSSQLGAISAAVNSGRAPGSTGAAATPMPRPLPTLGAPGEQPGKPYEPHTPAEAKEARALFDAVNAERKKKGLTPLAEDLQAERAAKVHSDDMAARDYFDHVTPEGTTPEDRVRMTGATGFSGVSENIALGQKTAGAVRKAWMASPGHKANILDPVATHAGVGYEAKGKRWTMVFLRR